MSDVDLALRSSIRNGMVFYYKRAGHCTRCEQPFGGNRATAYMVREVVAWRVYADAGFALTQRETAPVCDACATPREEAESTLESVCKGCEQVMQEPLRDIARTYNVSHSTISRLKA